MSEIQAIRRYAFLLHIITDTDHSFSLMPITYSHSSRSLDHHSDCFGLIKNKLKHDCFLIDPLSSLLLVFWKISCLIQLIAALRWGSYLSGKKFLTDF